ncbi:hypothetical protein [Pseudoneobacillus sp. C159]
MKYLFLISLLIIGSMTFIGCGTSSENKTEGNNVQLSLTEEDSSESKEEKHITTKIGSYEANNSESNLRKKLILTIEKPNQVPIQIDIKKYIPVLVSYLEQFDEPEREMNRIQSNYLFSNQERDFFLLSYNCGIKICNQLFLEHYQGDIKSIEVSEASFLQDFKRSNTYLAFLFGRNEGTEVIRNQVVIFNLQDFQKTNLPEDLGILESFEFPILSIEWKDGVFISTVAVVEDTSYDCIIEWNKNNKVPIQKLKWNIQET